MISNLVSIIIPCYNGEKYLEKTFNCILNQTYKNLEIFFINDGSIDKTEKIALKYKKIFTENKMIFNYIYQENQGQAAAVNNALKLINGEFLTWPDSDDIMTKDSIEKRVNFLKKNKEYGIVRNAVEIRDYDSDKKIGEFRLSNNINENIFEDLINCKNVFFSPISYMVSVEKFRIANPKMEIYPSRAGQNLQMLLPIAYKYKCGYIDEFLCTYYIRKNSYSRNKHDTLEKSINEYNNHIDVLKNTLESIGVYKKYEELIKYKFLRLKLNSALNFKDFILAKKLYEELKDDNQLKYKDKINFFIKKNKMLSFTSKKIKNIMRKLII